MRHGFVGLGTVVIFGLLIIGDCALGQAPFTKAKVDDASVPKTAATKKTKPKTTIVEFELLQSDDGSGLFAQHWLKILGPLNIELRVHRPVLNDKPELKERDAGNSRYVTAIGTLDHAGKITFPDRSFAVGDTNKLKEWIEELRIYGARGTPAGKPLWGLTKAQFATIYDSMIKSVDFETDDMPLAQMLARLPFRLESPLLWSPDATELLTQKGDHTKLKVELKGFSAATALAVALNEMGLGFRPNRNPNGDVELVVEPRNAKFEQWPIGWPLQRPTIKAAPKFYAMVPIELSERELSDVIHAASKLTETPILVDYAELDARQIHLEKIIVSYPRKMTNWDIALKAMVVPHRLRQEVWQDEAGRTFVWITSTRAGRAREPEKPKP